MGVAIGAQASRDLWPVGEDDLGALADDALREIEQRSRGGVDVDDSMGGVDDEDAVGHSVDQEIPGDGHELEQPKRQDADGEDGAGDDEADRRQVQAGSQCDVEGIQDAADPGKRDGDEDRDGLPALNGRRPNGRDDEEERSDEDVNVDPDDDEKEGRPVAIQERVRTGRARCECGPQETVLGVGRCEEDGDER